MKEKQRDYRCSICGRYFKPDCRAKNRQRTCNREACKKKQKAKSQRLWLQKNSGYFKGRYVKVKDWRTRNPDYQKRWRSKRLVEIQDEIRASKPYWERELLIPAVVLGSKIQDEILSVSRSPCGNWVVGTKKAFEIQDEMAQSVFGRVISAA
jgi:hypothetical protein